MLTVTFNINASSLDRCGAGENPNVVDGYSFAICPEDKAFRPLYGLMPEMFDDIIFYYGDFGELENIKDDPEIITDQQSNKFSKLLAEIAMVVATFVPLIILSYNICFVILLGIMNMMYGGTFFPESSGVTPKVFIGLCFLTIILLLPIGNYTFIQVLLTLLAMAGIAMANFMSGYYYADLDADAFRNQTEISFTQEKLDTTHVGQISIDYVANLSKMALCRNVTSQALMQTSIYEITSENLEDHVNCSAGVIDNVDIADEEFIEENILNNQSDYPSFINHDLKEVDYGIQQAISSTDYVYFGVQRPKSCKVAEFAEYECGSIPVLTPTIFDNGLINLIGKEFFSSVVNSTVNAIILNGKNKDIIFNGWKTLKSKADLDLEKSLELDKTDEDYKLAYETIKNRNGYAYKRLSYYYHQLVFNGMTTGIVNASKTRETGIYILDQTTPETILLTENVNAIVTDFNRANEIAKKIEKQHCMINSKGLASSYEFVKQLTANKEMRDTTSRCIDYKTLENYGLDSDKQPIKLLEAMTQITNLRKEIFQDIKEFSLDIAQRRTDVEQSFSKSLEDINTRSIFVELRKQGFMVIASYMMEISREIKVNELFFNALISSNNFNPLTVSDRMIADNLEDIVLKNTTFQSYNDNSDIFSKIPKNQSLGYYKNSVQYTQSLIENNQEKLFRGEVGLEDYISLLFTNPIKPLKEAIGNNADLADYPDYQSLMDLCMESIEDCPIPKTDPIADLNKYGHELIAQSASFFGVLASIKSFAYVNNTATKLKNKAAKSKDKKGKLTKLGKTASGKKAGKSIKYSNTVSNALSGASEMLSYLGSLVAIMLLCGVFLAYLLPLMPVFYFLVNFLNWILLFLQFWIVSPILVSQLIRWGDEKSSLKKALYYYFVKITLVPVLMVVGLVVGWHFLKVALFFLNVTTEFFFQSSASEGIIMSLVNNIGFLVILIATIYIAIKFSMALMNDLPNMILKKLDVESNDNNQNMIMDMVQARLGIGAMNKVAGASDALASNKKDKHGQNTNLRSLESIKEAELKKLKEEGNQEKDK
jgi:conjugal transfer/type IV secretion protein DotA/TraY